MFTDQCLRNMILFILLEIVHFKRFYFLDLIVHNSAYCHVIGHTFKFVTQVLLKGPGLKSNSKSGTLSQAHKNVYHLLSRC